MRPRADILVTALFLTTSAHAVEYEARAAQRFFTQSIPNEVANALLRVPSEQRFDLARTTYQLYGFARVWGRPTDILGLQFGLDTGLVEMDGDGLFPDSATVGMLAQDSLLLGPTFAELQLGDGGVVEIKAGKLFDTIASPAIFVAYGFGLSIDWDPSYADSDAPWRARASIVLPDTTFTSRGKTNPLLDFEAGYAFDRDTELWLSATMFIDNKDGLAPLLADALYRDRVRRAAGALAESRVVERFPEINQEALLNRYAEGVFSLDPATDGWLGWFGTKTSIVRDRWLLRGSAFLQVGRFNASASPNPEFQGQLDRLATVGPIASAIANQLSQGVGEDVRSLAYFADVSGGYALTDWLYTGAFFMLVSGDAGFEMRDDGTVNDRSFISIAPHLAYTSIFFDGGAASTLTFPTSASVAPDGAGLIAVGASAELTPLADLSIDAVFAWYRSNGGRSFETVTDTEGRAGGAFGSEVNLVSRYRIFDILNLTGDFGLFFPGNYYGGQLSTAYQVVIGAELTTPR